ncbi:MAG: Type IV pilus assembly protein PilM [Parcubacteria group bacterium Gr01-1014_48]|nr:MAG: Type IV pilus assembly protein PilM [Parcubacteria group bacterium Greene0416_14]TSC71691.1 MAG: Type IV pilus assembly protein PilM [Parcubacteria group bacterium Gr01-1014_48]TSD01092.1 MAG: Type IV pilus assembly protein PilM [Parcubacteria group bacterium Greene1014_15]TSD07962.1 MAG: Type IV pilus assembly protein PilM [Parcubacteria group bacterium Greene0714_4]
MAGLSISGIFSSPKKSVLGIDIGASAIKIVQIAKKGGVAVLETYGELALGPYGEEVVGRSVQLPVETLAEALRNLLRESSVTTNSCALAIPLSASLVSLVELPDIDKSQLAQMIPLEARKYIPVPISEVSLDWWIVPKEQVDDQVKKISIEDDQRKAVTMARKKADPILPSGKVDVLIVAIHNAALHTYQDIVTRAGLRTKFFEIEIFSAVRSVLEHGIAPVLVLDMGAASTKLYLVESGVVRDSHLVSRGSQDITNALAKALGITPSEAETIKRGEGLNYQVNGESIAKVVPMNLEYILSEANQIIAKYQKKFSKVVTHAVLIGGGVLLPGFVEFAKEMLSVDVLAGNPFGKLDAPAFLGDMLKKTGPEFAVAVGVALRLLQEDVP